MHYSLSTTILDSKKALLYLFTPPLVHVLKCYFYSRNVKHNLMQMHERVSEREEWEINAHEMATHKLYEQKHYRSAIRKKFKREMPQ